MRSRYRSPRAWFAAASVAGCSAADAGSSTQEGPDSGHEVKGSGPASSTQTSTSTFGYSSANFGNSRTSTSGTAAEGTLIFARHLTWPRHDGLQRFEHLIDRRTCVLEEALSRFSERDAARGVRKETLDHRSADRAQADPKAHP